MVDEENDFMNQYMKTCKEQIEKLAKDPELLNQTLKPFMQMSQQFMANSGLLGENEPNLMIPDLGNVDKVNKQIENINNNIKENYKELIKAHNTQDDVIKNLDKLSKRLRILVKKLMEEIDNK